MILKNEMHSYLIKNHNEIMIIFECNSIINGNKVKWKIIELNIQPSKKMLVIIYDVQNEHLFHNIGYVADFILFSLKILSLEESNYIFFIVE